jgi:hypothetical protein
MPEAVLAIVKSHCFELASIITEVPMERLESLWSAALASVQTIRDEYSDQPQSPPTSQ